MSLFCRSVVFATLWALQLHAFQGSRVTLFSTELSASAFANDWDTLFTERFPASVEDQIREASAALKRANEDGFHRHAVRLLLPVIGATDLDDWPGGTRQMAEAATPMMRAVLQNLGAKELSLSILDESDGIGAIMAQASNPLNDSCVVLLPSADTVRKLQSLDCQVGPVRDLILVNTQWNRKSDFGFFRASELVSFTERFMPTFIFSNLMVEGEHVRILRSYPGPWRVFSRFDDCGVINWRQIGDKPVLDSKPTTWDKDPANSRDGGRLFDFGQPAYQEIASMITSQDGFEPKTLAERASVASTFVKDTL